VSAVASLDELHSRLLEQAVRAETAPAPLLADAAAALVDVDLDAAGLAPRPLVALRLVHAHAYEAAWLVLRDNATGVVAEQFGQSTSSGAARTAPRLPLTTRIEPPCVYAWLPGFRDPRLDAPDSAYDITALATPRVRLDELWWDGPRLVLAGIAYLRHLTATPDDEIELRCARGDAAVQVFPGVRRRRPEFVRGNGAELTRLAWAGWSAEVPARRLRPSGRWTLSLRLAQDGLDHVVRLGPRAASSVGTTSGRVWGRSLRAGIEGARLHVEVGPSPAGRVLQVIAHPAARR
jgi:hypothetical protein